MLRHNAGSTKINVPSERTSLIGQNVYKNPNTVAASRSGLIATAIIIGLVALLALVLALIAMGRTGDDFPPTPNAAHPINKVVLRRISGESALSADLTCQRFNFSAEVFPQTRHSEDESAIAVNPVNPLNIIVTSHQGRHNCWLANTVRYSFDGGLTWAESEITTTRCQGATVLNSMEDFFCASDPWVYFGPDGTAYALSVSFNVGTDTEPTAVPYAEGIIMWKSADGGISWDPPQEVSYDDGDLNFQDKETIWVDPDDANLVHVSWADYPCFSFNGDCINDSVKNRRSFNRGATFEDPTRPTGDKWIVYYDRDVPGADELDLPQSWGCIMNKHRPTNTLMLTCLQIDDDAFDRARVVTARSANGGDTWDIPVVGPDYIIPAEPIYPPANAPHAGSGVRSFLFGADTQVHPESGYAYSVFHDATFVTGNSPCNIAMSMSKDGGLTWSGRVPVNPHLTHTQQMLPSVAVADDGTVAVLLYDDRNNVYNDGSTWLWDVFVVLFDENLNRIGETRITPNSFDLAASNLFLRGDSGGGFVPAVNDYMLIRADRNEFVGVITLVEQEYTGDTGINPFPTPYFVDEEDRLNMYFFRTSRSCIEGGEDVDFARFNREAHGKLTKHVTHKKTSQPKKHNRTVAPERMVEMACDAWEERMGGIGPAGFESRMREAFEHKFGVTTSKKK